VLHLRDKPRAFGKEIAVENCLILENEGYLGLRVEDVPTPEPKNP